jgi:hypothetical protein
MAAAAAGSAVGEARASIPIGALNVDASGLLRRCQTSDPSAPTRRVALRTTVLSIGWVVVLFHIQARGPRGWEAVGSGEGSGPDREIAAVRDLHELSGGLPAGTYRVIAARTGHQARVEVELDANGEIVEEPGS